MQRHDRIPCSSALARSDLVIEPLDDDYLVYDPVTDRFHCLNDALMRIWRASDSERSARQLATYLAVPLVVIQLGWDMLVHAQLLARDHEPFEPAQAVIDVFHLLESGKLTAHQLPRIESIGQSFTADLLVIEEREH